LDELEISTLHPFGQALQTLFRQRGQFLTGGGNVNWSAAAKAIPGVSYETLRKAVAGERAPGPTLTARVTTALGLPPDYFLESQLKHARRQFDPRVVGWRTAVANLRWFQRAVELANSESPPPRSTEVTDDE
jgi:hypothetical protein